MRWLLSVFVGISVVFLINYLLQRRINSKNNLDSNSVSTEDNDPVPVRYTNNSEDIGEKSGKNKARIKKILKFVLIYLAITYTSAILQGALSGFVVVYVPRFINLAKIFPPLIVFLISFYLLSIKYSIEAVSKIMLIIYLLIVILRMLYYLITDNIFMEIELYSYLPYVLCLLISTILYFIIKSQKSGITT